MNFDSVQVAKFTSELIGTYALVFAGTGAIVVNDVTHGAISHLGIALTFGLVIMSMIYTLGDISGAHLNPVVTLVFWLMKRLPIRELPIYLLAQVLGALLASVTLRCLFWEHPTLGATIPSGTATQSFILEMILTSILIFVVLRVATGAKERGITAAIAIGAVVALEAIFAGPICGASMNPFRSLAPAIVSGHFVHQWLYVVAPVSGAFIAILLFKLCDCPQAESQVTSHRKI